MFIYNTCLRNHGDCNHGDCNHGDCYHGDCNHGDCNHGMVNQVNVKHGDGTLTVIAMLLML